MLKKMNLIILVLIGFVVVLGSQHVRSTQSKKDPKIMEKVEQIGKRIQYYQKQEVWSGGNEYYGCYMWTHRDKYLRQGGAKQFVAKAKTDPKFIEGVKALRNFNKTERFSFYKKWKEPVYPTWAMIGEISNKGTTDAGYITQQEIADALVELVKDMFLHPEKYEH